MAPGVEKSMYKKYCSGEITDKQYRDWCSQKLGYNSYSDRCKQPNKEYRDSHKEQERLRAKEYRLNNQPKIKEYSRKYIKSDKYRASRKEHPEWDKKYYQKNKLKIRKKQKIYSNKYRKTETCKLKQKECKSKRRDFEFVPINNYFEGSVAHHIDKKNVIFVSKEINRIKHKQSNNIEMNYINILAWTEMEFNSLC